MNSGSEASQLLGTFWNSSREELIALRWEARRRIASPWALLCIALVRSLLTIPYTVRYRSALFPEGSPLNLALALVGSSGVGKSTASKGAALAIRWEGEDVPISSMPRSGEAIAAMLGYMDAPAKGADPELRWRRHDHAVWAHYEEVGHLGAQGARTGSTVLEVFKSLTSGEHLGGQNSKGDGLAIPSASYRAVLTVAVQPDRAEPLLNPGAIASGLAARFIWIDAADAATANDPRPSLETDPVIRQLNQWDGVRFVDALPEMDAAHEADTRAGRRGERAPIDSRRVLNRALIAIALANMAGRAVLIPEDWHLAGLILQHSDDVLAAVRDDLAAPADDHRGDLERKALTRMTDLRAAGDSWQTARRRLSNAQQKALTAMLAEGRVSPFPDDATAQWPVM